MCLHIAQTACKLFKDTLSVSALGYDKCFVSKGFYNITISGADPGFFLGGGALVSCSTSTPINHIVFFLQNTSCIRKPQVISRGGGVRTPCTLPLDPAMNIQTYLPFLEQTHTGFGVTGFTSASASACFLSPFPDLTKK